MGLWCQTLQKNFEVQTWKQTEKWVPIDWNHKSLSGMEKVIKNSRTHGFFSPYVTIAMDALSICPTFSVPLFRKWGSEKFAKNESLKAVNVSLP